MSQCVKIVVFVPRTHSDQVRQAMGDAGAGRIGSYGYCTFSVSGTGRFLPLEGARPSIGEVGRLEAAQEERIECVCDGSLAKDVLKAVRKVHPYEQAAIDIYPLIDEDTL